MRGEPKTQVQGILLCFSLALFILALFVFFEKKKVQEIETAVLPTALEDKNFYDLSGKAYGLAGALQFTQPVFSIDTVTFSRRSPFLGQPPLGLKDAQMYDTGEKISETIRLYYYEKEWKETPFDLQRALSLYAKVGKNNYVRFVCEGYRPGHYIKK